jgi:hypothetical protein
LLVMLCLEIVVVGLLYVPIPPNPDHELYDYMAWSALEHGGLYRNAGDTNMPGEALRHLVSMVLFGNHYWSYRLLDYLLLVVYTGAIALLSQRYHGALYGGLFFGLYLIVYTTSGYWMSGQRDVLATHAIVLAGFTYLRRLEGGRFFWVLIAALVLVEAALMKPTYLAFGPILVVSAAFFARRGLIAQIRDAWLLAIVAAGFLGVIVVLGWATDSLWHWYEMSVLFSSRNYIGGAGFNAVLLSIAATVLRSWHWYTLMALSGLFCWMFANSKASLSVIFAAMATVVVSTLVQRKGFGYHFGGLLIVIALLSAFYMAEIIRLAWRIPDAKLRYSILSFPAILVLGGLISKGQREFTPQVNWYLGRAGFAEMLRSREFDDVMAASSYARTATRPGDSVWSYTSHVMINSLADRPIPTRYVNYSLLRCRTSSRLEERWRGEVEAVFRDQPPVFIVLERNELAAPGEFMGMGSIRPEEPVSVLKDAVDRAYRPECQIGRFAFFRRVANQPSEPNPVPAALPADRRPSSSVLHAQSVKHIP